MQAPILTAIRLQCHICFTTAALPTPLPHQPTSLHPQSTPQMASLYQLTALRLHLTALRLHLTALRLQLTALCLYLIALRLHLTALRLQLTTLHHKTVHETV